jgi:O-antigen ligase
VTSFSDLIGSARAVLPAPPLVRWASIFFTLSVLTCTISLAASQVLLAAAGVAYAIHVVREGSVPSFLPVNLPLAIFCLATVTSVLFAENPEVGLPAVRKLVLFLIWPLSVNLVRSTRHLRWLLQGLFLESGLAGVVALDQFARQYREAHTLHPGEMYFYLTATRIHGFVGHWMNFGGQQMLIFSVFVTFLLLTSQPDTGPSRAKSGSLPARSDPGHRPHWLWWVVLAIIALSIFLNFTRGVWLGCLAAMVYVLARWKAWWLWVLPVLIALAYLASPSLVRRRVQLAIHPSRDPALSIRLEMWQVAWRMIRAHPVVGVGPNNIEEVYMLYLPHGKVPIVGYHNHLHDNFLQIAAERGLPCLVAWVWLMGALGWSFWRIRTRLFENRWIADAALAAWLSLLVEGCFEFNFGTSPVLMVFLFATSTPFIAMKAAS